MFTSLSCFLFQIELLTLLFLNSLAEEAKAKAFEEKSATIRAQHLKAVSKVSPKRALIIKFAAVRAAFVTVNTHRAHLTFNSSITSCQKHFYI